MPARPKKTNEKKPAPRPARSSKAAEPPADAVQAAAVLIGKGLGTAVHRTRAVKESLSAVGTSIADAGSRAGRMLKKVLPSAKAPAKKAAKAASPPRQARKTVAPPPAHGEDALTHDAAPKTKRPTKGAAPAAVDTRRRVSAPRRG
jgi:hypothetical protein